MEKEITIKTLIPVCECGVQGDMIIVLSNSDIDHIWCSVCGKRFPNKPLGPDGKDWCGGTVFSAQTELCVKCGQKH